MKRKEKVSFFITLIVTVILLAATFSVAVIGSLTERSALSVIGEAGLDVFMAGHSYVSPEKTDKKSKNAVEKMPIIPFPTSVKSCTLSERKSSTATKYAISAKKPKRT